jgi:AraC-like DNA-binding protein
MSNYIEILPGKNLVPFIECFWVRTPNDSSHHIVLPDGCIDIVFKFDDNDQAEGLVVGTMTTPLRVEASGNFVGVRFKPGKSSMFLIFGASELTDKTTELRNIAGPQGSNLVEQLSNSGDISNQIKILNTSLTAWLRHNNNDRVDYVIQKIMGSQGNISINSICSSLGLSRQHLARLFQEYVGIGPKQFARVIRFQSLLKNVRENPRINWADEAVMLGYYDQAHLISDFRQFSGTSPERFATR